MSVFWYELAKIFRRRAVQITLLAFVFVNVFNLVTAHPFPYDTEADIAAFEAEQAVIRSLEGPLDEELAARLIQRIEELRNDIGSKEYITGSRSLDLEIYERQLSALEKLYDYQERAGVLKGYISDRLAELEGSNHTYEIRRLELMQDVYSSRRVTSYYHLTGFSNTYYMGYEFSSLLVALLLLIGIPPLFSAEYECGMDVLLKTARRGRHHTVRCKWIASLVFTAFCGLLLFVTDLIYFQSIYPFNLWQAPLFSVTAFYNTPLNLTVGGFILLNWAAKIFGLWVVALVIALFSSLLRRTYFAFFFGAGFLFAMMATGDHLRMLNPLSLVNFAEYAKDFNTVNVCGLPVLTIVALPMTMVFVAGVLIALIHWSQSRTEGLLRLRLPQWRKSQRHTGYAARSGGGEWRKRLVKQRFALVIVVVILLKIVTLGASATEEYFVRPSDRAMYDEWVQTYGGPLDEGTVLFIEEESARIEADQKALKQLELEWQAGLLSDSEYAVQQEDYQEQARLSSVVWNRVSEEYAYAANDPDRRFLADARGWGSVFGSASLDVLLLLLIVLISGTAFSFEWESGMADTLRTSRYGRRRLAWNKMAVSTICTIGIALLFEGILFLFAAGRYEVLAYWNYPLQTLKFFESSESSLTIGQFYLVSRIFRLLGWLYVQAIACAISAGTKRSLTAVFASTALVVVPYFLLREKSSLYTVLPTPLSLLASNQFAFSNPQWLTWIVSVVALFMLTLFAVERFAAQKRGRRGI